MILILLDDPTFSVNPIGVGYGMEMDLQIDLGRLLCPLMEKKDKILSAHNQIDMGNLLSNV